MGALLLYSHLFILGPLWRKTSAHSSCRRRSEWMTRKRTGIDMTCYIMGLGAAPSSSERKRVGNGWAWILDFLLLLLIIIIKFDSTTMLRRLLQPVVTSGPFGIHRSISSVIHYNPKSITYESLPFQSQRTDCCAPPSPPSPVTELSAEEAGQWWWRWQREW